MPADLGAFLARLPEPARPLRLEPWQVRFMDRHYPDGARPAGPAEREPTRPEKRRPADDREQAPTPKREHPHTPKETRR